LGSNLNLGVGIPAVDKLLEAGVNICLGTDSAASNNNLDIFNEMRLIKKHFPLVPSGEIIRMATLNGARALGMDEEYGSFEPDKQADILILPLNENIINPSDLEDYIVTSLKGSDVTRLAIL
jgi:5-methylthioadenosine/S-adenosylhomocysteine deaminase